MQKNLRRIAAIMLFITMLAGCLPFASANEFTYFKKDEQISFANGCLTEVFGYTAEEAGRFFYEHTEKDGIATINYWHPDFPDWIYTSTFSMTDGKHLSSSSPFHSDDYRYPGENSVRSILTQVQEKQLLTNWNKEARETFRAILENDGLRPSAELDKGLMTATYTAQQALQDYFITCYGAPENWPEAVTEWYQWLLDTCQLETAEAGEAAQGVTRYRSEGDNPMVLTEFNAAMPPELCCVAEHPMLQGWEVLSGAVVVFEENFPANSPEKNRGLIAFGKNDERILCLVQQTGDDNGWAISPVSKTVLPAGCRPVITRSDPMSVFGSHRYKITFSTEKYDDVTLQVSIHQSNGASVCRLTECSFTDNATGDLFQTSESDSLYLVSRISNEGEKDVSITSCSYPSSLTHLDTLRLFEYLQNPISDNGFMLPERMVMIGSVHLRKDTSSHSRDLGTLNAGTIGRLISIEAGDPNPWYHVEIGTKTGYVSGAYVEESAGSLSQACLPVAVATEDCSLKENTGLFAPEAAKVAKGTTMHIIMSEGGWHYVCIPRQQPAGMRMDPEGTFGYIRNGKVATGGSALELEWKLGPDCAVEQ